jgi:hypothetical protein
MPFEVIMLRPPPQRTSNGEWAIVDSNHGPPPYQGVSVETTPDDDHPLSPLPSTACGRSRAWTPHRSTSSLRDVWGMNGARRRLG